MSLQALMHMLNFRHFIANFLSDKGMSGIETTPYGAVYELFTNHVVSLHDFDREMSF